MGAFSCTAFRGLYRGLDDWQAVYGALEAGDVLRQPALAKLIELLADGRPEGVLRGRVADAIAAAIQRGGGLMEAARPRRARGGVGGSRCARRTATSRSPSCRRRPRASRCSRSCGSSTASTSAPLDPADRAHLMIEAVKIGLRDRDDHVTDPAHAMVPPEALLTDEWIDDAPRRDRPGVGAHPAARSSAARRDRLPLRRRRRRAPREPHPVELPRRSAPACTCRSGGSTSTTGARRSRSTRPGSTRSAPSKRPMHTLIPAMVLRDGQPSLVFGSMGGDAQAQVHAQLLTRIVDDGADPQAAIDAPRWRVEPLGLEAAGRDAVRSRGARRARGATARDHRDR